MSKETAWAIGIGIIFGLILAFGLWRIYVSTSENPIKPNPTPTPFIETPSPTHNAKMSILSPQGWRLIPMG
jgi:hypothetical protein